MFGNDVAMQHGNAILLPDAAFSSDLVCNWSLKTSCRRVSAALRSPQVRIGPDVFDEGVGEIWDLFWFQHHSAGVNRVEDLAAKHSECYRDFSPVGTNQYRMAVRIASGWPLPLIGNAEPFRNTGRVQIRRGRLLRGNKRGPPPLVSREAFSLGKAQSFSV